MLHQCRFGHSLSILGPLEKIGMEEGLRGGVCPQLLDLMPNKRDWIVKDDGRGGEMKASQLEVESLELRLGLPATEEEKDPSVLSLALFYKSSKTTTNNNNNKNHHCAGSKRGFFGTFESRAEGISSQMFAFLDGFRFVYHILLLYFRTSAAEDKWGKSKR